MIHTAQDVVDYLLSATGGGAQDGEHRAIRQAVIHGVREVLHARDWLWHTKTGTFTIQQVTATASFTANSTAMNVNSSVGMLVGRLIDAPAQFFANPPRIISVNSNVSVTLDTPALVTGANVTVRAQTYYDLPYDLRDIDALITNTVGTLHCYITPQEYQRLEVTTRGAGEPFYYTIMRSDVNPDRFQVRFVGVPTTSVIVHFTYRYQPKMVKYMGYEPICRQGTVTITQPNAGNFVCTGTGTNFQEDMAGAMIRFGTATQEAEPIGALLPFQAEARIVSRPAFAAFTLKTLPPLFTNVKYAISDIIDCSPQMYTAILSGSEMWYARLAGKPGKDVVELFQLDLRRAMERDVISPLSGRPKSIGFPTPRAMGYYSAQQPDQGS